MERNYLDYKLPENGENLLADFLVGPELQQLMSEAADFALAAYRQRVKKVTGYNARSSKSYTEIGGARHDRWVGVVETTGRYSVSREFGSSRNAPEGNLRAISQMFGQ